MRRFGYAYKPIRTCFHRLAKYKSRDSPNKAMEKIFREI